MLYALHKQLQEIAAQAVLNLLGRLQAVPVLQPGHNVGHRAVFDWQEHTGSLFAAGGAHPSVVHKWDVQQELCTQQACSPHQFVLRHKLVVCNCLKVQSM